MIHITRKNPIKKRKKCIVILKFKTMIHQSPVYVCMLDHCLNVLMLLKAANSSDDMSPSPKPAKGSS